MPISSEDLAIASKTALNKYLKNPVVDQIGIDCPLYTKLLARRKQFNGALQNIVVQIRKDYGSGFKWAFGESKVNFNTRDTVEQASFAWRRCEDGFRIPYDILFTNGISVKEGERGSFKLTHEEGVKLTDIMQEQMESFKLGFTEKLSLELHRDGTASTDAVVGLDGLISTTPTTGIVGGINRATTGNEYWRNYADLTLNTGAASGSNNISDCMEKAWRACIRNGGSPDFILAGSDFIDAYKKYGLSGGITNNAESGAIKRVDAGIGSGTSTGLYFKGVEIIWDPQFSDLDALESATTKWEKRCYFLNMRYLEMHDDGIDITSPTRPHDTLTFFQMATQRLALVMRRANAHAVLALA